MSSRILTPEEKRLVVDALRAAAAATRVAKHEASSPELAFVPLQTAHIDRLARRAGTLDRLAVEVTEYDVRLERLKS